MSSAATDVLGTVEGAPPPAPAATSPQAAPGATPPSASPNDDAARRMEARIAELTAEQGRLRAAISRPPAPAPQPTAQPAQPNPEEARRQFWNNPLETSAAIGAHMANTVIGQHYDTLVATARREAREQFRNKDLFDKYAGEIEQFVRQSVQPQFLTNINVWSNAARVVIAEHIDDIRAEAQRTTGAPAVRTADGPAAPSPRQPAPPAKTELSREERDFIRRYDITEDQFRAGKAAIETGGKGEYVTKDNAFDDAVTFDSRQARRRARAAGR